MTSPACIPPSISTTLISLPPEILIKILFSANSLDDLGALILTCRAVEYAYRLRPDQILCHVLLEDMGDCVGASAITAARMPILLQGTDDHASVGAFCDTIDNWKGFDMPSPREVFTIAVTHRAVKELAWTCLGDYPTLPESSGHLGVMASHLAADKDKNYQATRRNEHVQWQVAIYDVEIIQRYMRPKITGPEYRLITWDVGCVAMLLHADRKIGPRYISARDRMRDLLKEYLRRVQREHPRLFGMEHRGYNADYALTLGLVRVSRMIESMALGRRERILALNPVPLATIPFRGHVDGMLYL